MGIFTRIRDTLIGWPALERTPLGVLNPTAGVDAALNRWRASFFEGLNDASPPDDEEDWEDDGLDELRRQTREQVWKRRQQ